MTTKHAVFNEKLGEYLKGSRQEKGRILDAVCSVTAVHRKAAVRCFSKLQMQSPNRQERRGRKKVYDRRTTSALKEVWEVTRRVCAERLHPIIEEYVRIFKRDGMWQYDTPTTERALSMSLATMKRRIGLFSRIKKGGGRGTTKPSHLKEIIPIRRGPWNNPPPGNGEIDTVAHCGYTIAGDFAYTVQYTDVATVWTCLVAQWNKGEAATQESIACVQERLPFSLKGIDPDSGSEFINWHLKSWCDERCIVMTRTRPYMKNDHARIEQKNYTNVRQIVGYSRFDTPEHVRVLNELYETLEDYINFFIPSVVCIEKVRSSSSRTKRRYDTAKTAYQRVLQRDDISEETKEGLRKKYATLNPLLLKQKCDRILLKLGKIRSRLR